MKKEFIAIQVVCLSLPALAFASPAAGASAGIGSLWLPVVNFTFYALLLRYLYKKYGLKILRQRRVEIKEYVSRVAGELAEAQSKLDDIRARLSDIDGEKADLVKRYEAEGAVMSEKIIANAHAQAARVKIDAKRQIEMELNQAKKRLRVEAVRGAALLAREEISKALSVERDRELRKQVLREVLSERLGV